MIVKGTTETIGAAVFVGISGKPAGMQVGTKKTLGLHMIVVGER